MLNDLRNFFHTLALPSHRLSRRKLNKTQYHLFTFPPVGVETRECDTDFFLMVSAEELEWMFLMEFRPSIKARGHLLPPMECAVSTARIPSWIFEELRREHFWWQNSFTGISALLSFFLFLESGNGQEWTKLFFVYFWRAWSERCDWLNI